MPGDLIATGRCALISGGASGIGLGIAQALLEAGLNVVVTDVRPDHLQSAKATLASVSDRTLFLTLDVADPEQWREARCVVEERFGQLHVLCLNAGIGVLGSMLDSGDADWTWLTSVNLEGVLNGVEVFLPHLVAHGQPAHIIATSSMGGLIVANDGGIYSAAKFGVVALIENLRRELEGSAVSASVLCPAAVNTNIFDHERMRPVTYSDKVRDQRAINDAEAFAREILSRGRSPIEVGRMVRDAIAEDALYVFTDRNVRSSLVARRDALLAFT
ncbi:MAG TPA: SDR family NAD(P)-dependent oxidoreductase [Sphingomonas sp.]|nr:SDR family NAD(P)-dependent oxidoreductase [Sphingomonas sp.]